jgi:4-hydroxy-tetrahydrodipicolinate synthase
MVYHIPQVTHVPISFNLLEELISVSDGRLVGVKDSSGDAEHARELCRRFPDLNIFVGSDRLLLAGLQVGADGCITAGSNVLGPLAVDVYRAYATGDPAEPLQERLTAARLVFERYQPFPAGLKSLLALRYGGDSWNVRPPLAPLSDSDRAELLLALRNLNLENRLPWLANLE